MNLRNALSVLAIFVILGPVIGLASLVPFIPVTITALIEDPTLILELTYKVGAPAALLAGLAFLGLYRGTGKFGIAAALPAAIAGMALALMFSAPLIMVPAVVATVACAYLARRLNLVPSLHTRRS